MFKKAIIAALITATAVSSLTACTNATPDTTPTSTTAEHLNPQDFKQIIDVRSEKEYNKEHIEGAINISIQNDSFNTEAGKLDKKANYYLYSNGGGRADTAITNMKELGFTGNLTNGGSIQEASKQLTLPIVKPEETK